MMSITMDRAGHVALRALECIRFLIVVFLLKIFVETLLQKFYNSSLHA